jgi:uncharacterized protein YecT (DUF1311 family)
MSSLNCIVTAAILLPLCLVGHPVKVEGQSEDPCGGSTSNVEMRECYAKEQVRANREADALAEKISTDAIQDSKDPAFKGPEADLLQKSAASLARSQKSWKAYRDQHCAAVEYSWTTGSGAGTAYEACMFHLGRARAQELKADFNFNEGKQ